jgi:hypothetical protein
MIVVVASSRNLAISHRNQADPVLEALEGSFIDYSITSFFTTFSVFEYTCTV